MSALISSVFGVTSFLLIIAGCLWAMKPTRGPHQDRPDSSAIPAALSTPLLRMEDDRFLSFGLTSELKLPKITLRVESLRLAGPVSVPPSQLRQQSPVPGGQVTNNFS